MHTKEVMQFAKILHGELMLKCCNNPLKERLRGSSEDDIIMYSNK